MIINNKVRRAGIMVLPRRQGRYSFITIRSISILHQFFYRLLQHNIWMISSGTLSDGAWYQSHVVCSFILSPGRELCMQRTGYLARVLFGVFNTCTAACLHWRRPRQSRCITFGQEGDKIFDGLWFPWDLRYCPRLSSADHIYCPTDLHLVVESPFVPKDLWALFSLKITQLGQKVLP